MMRIDTWPFHATGHRRTLVAATPSGMSLVTAVLRSELAVNVMMLPVQSTTSSQMPDELAYFTVYVVTHSSSSSRPCVVIDETAFKPLKFACIQGFVSLPSADHAPVHIYACVWWWMSLSFDDILPTQKHVRSHYQIAKKLQYCEW